MIADAYSARACLGSGRTVGDMRGDISGVRQDYLIPSRCPEKLFIASPRASCDGATSCAGGASVRFWTERFWKATRESSLFNCILPHTWRRKPSRRAAARTWPDGTRCRAPVHRPVPLSCSDARTPLRPYPLQRLPFLLSAGSGEHPRRPGSHLPGFAATASASEVHCSCSKICPGCHARGGALFLSFAFLPGFVVTLDIEYPMLSNSLRQRVNTFFPGLRNVGCDCATPTNDGDSPGALPTSSKHPLQLYPCPSPPPPRRVPHDCKARCRGRVTRNADIGRLDRREEMYSTVLYHRRYCTVLLYYPLHACVC